MRLCWKGQRVPRNGKRYSAFGRRSEDGFGKRRSACLTTYRPDARPVESASQDATPAGLVIEGIKGSYETSEAPYRPAIELSGRGFDRITAVRWFWSRDGTAVACSVWISADGFAGKFVRLSDTSGYMRPILAAQDDPPGIYRWKVIFAAGADRVEKSFLVSISPVRPAPNFQTVDGEHVHVPAPDISDFPSQPAEQIRKYSSVPQQRWVSISDLARSK